LAHEDYSLHAPMLACEAALSGSEGILGIMLSETAFEKVLEFITAGWNLRHASQLARISRQAVWKRRKVSASFNRAVMAALEAGEEIRVRRAWLNHPFRGRRPPTSRGHGGKPRFVALGGRRVGVR